LFDTPRFARNLENAYTQMRTLAQQGLAPEDIHVARPDQPPVDVSKGAGASGASGASDAPSVPSAARYTE
jgi:hypothetical protein